MSLTRINARIIDQTLQLTNTPLLASGGVREIQVVCDFCDLWAGYGKTAVFYRKDGQVYHVPMFDDSAVVPWEVMVDAGTVYFGIIGVADNTRTTEVVEIRVEQGAITSHALVPGDPTPDVYSQIMANLGVTQGRLNQMIAMKAVNGTTSRIVEDEYFTGTIRTNGASGYIDIYIKGLSLVAYGNHTSDYCIPPELAPLDVVHLESNVEGVRVSLWPDVYEEAEGWGFIQIENEADTYLDTNTSNHCRGFYPLASMSIAELGDIRTGYNGEEYETAGEAVRQQISKLTGFNGDEYATKGYVEQALPAIVQSEIDNLKEPLVEAVIAELEKRGKI